MEESDENAPSTSEGCQSIQSVIDVALEHMLLNGLFPDRLTILRCRLVCRAWRRTVSDQITCVTVQRASDLTRALIMYPITTPTQPRKPWREISDCTPFARLKFINVTESVLAVLIKSKEEALRWLSAKGFTLVLPFKLSDDTKPFLEHFHTLISGVKLNLRSLKQERLLRRRRRGVVNLEAIPNRWFKALSNFANLTTLKLVFCPCDLVDLSEPIKKVIAQLPRLTHLDLDITIGHQDEDDRPFLLAALAHELKDAPGCMKSCCVRELNQQGSLVKYAEYENGTWQNCSIFTTAIIHGLEGQQPGIFANSYAQAKAIVSSDQIRSITLGMILQDFAGHAKITVELTPYTSVREVCFVVFVTEAVGKVTVSLPPQIRSPDPDLQITSIRFNGDHRHENTIIDASRILLQLSDHIPKLRELHFSDVFLSPKAQRMLLRLPRLTFLQLHLVGKRPHQASVVDASSFPRGLEHLDLEANYLSSWPPSPMSSLTRLVMRPGASDPNHLPMFELYKVDVSALSASSIAAAFPNLQDLDFVPDEAGVAPLSSLRLLRKLNITSHQVRSFTGMKALTQVSVLALRTSWNQSLPFQREIGTLKQLRRLELLTENAFEEAGSWLTRTLAATAICSEEKDGSETDLDSDSDGNLSDLLDHFLNHEDDEDGDLDDYHDDDDDDDDVPQWDPIYQEFWNGGPPDDGDDDDRRLSISGSDLVDWSYVAKQPEEADQAPEVGTSQQGDGDDDDRRLSVSGSDLVDWRDLVKQPEQADQAPETGTGQQGDEDDDDQRLSVSGSDLVDWRDLVKQPEQADLATEIVTDQQGGEGSSVS